MAIEEKVILKLERLAKLKLSPTERAQIGDDLENILKMVNTLQEVDTDGVDPLVYIHNEVNVLRNDKPEGMLDREEGLKNAPKRIENYFAVPKIIKR